jgi:two-component system, NarL family, response regulator NreC
VHPHTEVQAGNQAGKMIRCALVHDHILLRQGLRRILEDEPDIEVVTEAASAPEALRKISLHNPEVVISDAHIFECEAEQAERMILAASQNSRVLFVTAHEGHEPHNGKKGTNSCAVRETSSAELVEMVRTAAALERVEIRETSLTKDWHRHNFPAGQVLTAREREVVKLLAEGRTVRSAAEILGLSVKTVDAHKFNLMRKLGIHNKAELVMWAIQKRVVRVPARL